MTTAFKNFITVNKKQYIIYLVLFIIATGLAGISNYLNNHLFDRFFGGLNPVIIGSLISIAGILCLSGLISKGWFSIYKKKDTDRLGRIMGLALIFVSITILIDIKIHFPRHMNIAFPASLLYYPSIGFLVELLFHVLPVTIIIFCLTYLLKNTNIEKIIWVSIMVVALLEPIYQSWYLTSYSTWTMVLVGLNLYFFNLAQLIIFRKFDFLSMLAFRCIYYLIWHILWGYIRLTILF